MKPGADLYPVALDVAGCPCLVVGGGRVAARKIAGLLRCGADVTVVAPQAHVAMGLLARDCTLDERKRASIRVQPRPYRRGEAANYRLVLAATGLPGVDAAVHEDATAAGVWVNSADDPAHCSFVLPAVHRDGPVTVAVATGGVSPAFAAWLRRRVADALGPDVAELACLLGEARRVVHEQGASTEQVPWAAMLDGGLPQLVSAGRVADARELVARAVEDALAGIGHPDVA